MTNERARQLRKNQTDAERKLWRDLRVLKEEGFHFRRQAPIDHLIVDFACLSTRLVIELDGGQHNMDAGRRADAARDAYLYHKGFNVLRFWNNEVMSNSEGVMQIIRSAIGLNQADSIFYSGQQPPAREA